MRSVLVLLLLSGTAAAGVTEERARDLEHLLTQDCGSCHGLTLKGGLGRPLTAEALAGADPQRLADVILDGMPGTAMPSWRPLLTEDEARWIADQLTSDGASK